MSEKVKEGETRQEGWLYFVKGENLEVWKAKMQHGRKKKKSKQTSFIIYNGSQMPEMWEMDI